MPADGPVPADGPRPRRTPTWPTGQVLLGLLALATAADLAAAVLDLPALERVAKPLLMPLLAAWVLAVADRPVRSPVRWLLLGLGLAWLGDLLLLAEGDGWFLAGLLAFLLMQLAYLVAFRGVPGPGLLRRRPWWALPYLAVWVGMNAWLREGVGEMLLPVLVYSAVLVAMALVALDRAAALPRPHGARLAVGGALFVVSDGTLAAVAFDGLDGGAGTSVLVMATYVAAQLLIAAGLTLGTARDG